MSQSPTTFLPARTRQRYQSGETLLRDKALRFMSDYPDVHNQAWVIARQLLRELTGKLLDPDRVWWHRFTLAASSPRSFTDWRHAGTPNESMTLVQLLMHRFNAHDQQAPDELPMYGGFYTDGPQYGSYDEHNEVALAPQRLLERFWALDFARLFRQRVDSFWNSHALTFCEVAKARFLAAAGLALRRGHLSMDDLQVLARTITPIDELASEVPARLVARTRQLSVCSFDIGGYESSRIIRVVDANGWQIVYAPGLPRAFQLCRSERDMLEWVRSQLAPAESRRLFEAQFVTAAQADQERAQGLAQVMEQIIALRFDTEHNRFDPQAARLLNQNSRVIAGDVFEHLRELSRQETSAVADALTSNADLRKQMWIGYLGSFIRMSGPFAAFAWPLTLLVTGAGIASVALHTDQALHGHSARARHAGLVGAVLNSIFVLFNLPLLVDAAAGIRVAGADAAGLDAPAAGSSTPESLPLQPLNHERLLSGNLPMQGVERSATGETWIMLDGTPQPVRFSARLNTWVVIDPQNPFSFFDVTPVRLDAQGQWQRLPTLRLDGGMEPGGSALAVAGPGTSTAAQEPLATVQSAFWDVHMRFNLAEEERLSTLAVERQKAVLHTREVQPGDELERDSENDEVLVDAWSNEYRVFKSAEGRYVGGRVTRYTLHEEEFNQYLRTGVARIENQVEMIEELLEDLHLIGVDNQVNLYRGGSGARSTSGLTFRNGHIKTGDVLVNTDFTSFSENPYVTRSFASSQAGAQSYGFSGNIHFDDTSIVFELPAGQHLGATPIAPFSVEGEEAESLFTPGHYFEVQGIDEVLGTDYRFVRVQIREIPGVAPGRPLYEMRTGLPFTREMYAARLGESGKRLVDRFFPLPVAMQGSV